jgi:hypothetical protein
MYSSTACSRSSLRSARRTSLYQALRYNKYVGSLGQRLGYLPVSFNLDGDESIWIHAVSVGEVLTARPLVAELRRATRGSGSSSRPRRSPGSRWRAERASDVDGSSTSRSTGLHRPPHARLVRPRLFVMMETEIWPNLLRECRRRGVKTVLVNGRISPAPTRATGSCGRSSGACSPTSTASACRARNRRAARRARRRSGARHVTGSLKFDSLGPRLGRARPRPRAPLLPRRAGPRPCSWPAARCAARRRRAARVSADARRRGRTRCSSSRRAIPSVRRGRAARREEGSSTVAASELPIDAEPRADVVVLDTIGELAQLYQVATSCSSAAASSTPAATTSSSRRCSASRSSSARTCRTSPRSPGVPRQRRGRAGADGRELEAALLGAARRSGAAREPRRGGARAGRGQPRRPRPDAVISVGNLSRRRQRQDAARGAGRGPAARAGRTAVDPQPRLRANRAPSDGVVVVSDGARLARRRRSRGDEPLMLARRCPASRCSCGRPAPGRPRSPRRASAHGARARRRVPAPCARARRRPGDRGAADLDNGPRRCRPAGCASRSTCRARADARGACEAPDEIPAWPSGASRWGWTGLQDAADAGACRAGGALGRPAAVPRSTRRCGGGGHRLARSGSSTRSAADGWRVAARMAFSRPPPRSPRADVRGSPTRRAARRARWCSPPRRT